MTMLGVSTGSLGSSTTAMVVQSQAQHATLPSLNGKVLALPGSKRQCLCYKTDSLLMGLVHSTLSFKKSRPTTGPFTTAVAAVDSDQLSSSDPPNKNEAKSYYFLVANAKFMLDEEEHFQEQLFERLRHCGERDKEQDFWLVIEPKFLDRFPDITKRLKRPAVALVSTNGPWITISMKLWACNFNSQLANALSIEGDYRGSISALECGYVCATEISYPELQMFFTTSILHVHLMQWDEDSLVEQAVNKCNEIWDSIGPDKRRQCPALLFYNELLHIFYRLRLCDYKNAAPHVDNLDAAMKADMQQTQRVQELTKELDALDQSLSRSDLHHRDRVALSKKQAMLQEQLRNMNGLSSVGPEYLEPVYFGNVRKTLADKLQLASPPIDGEWLPKSAVYALVDLIVVIFGRPKGLFKECGKRIQSGMHLIQDELVKLGITDGVREVDLQHSSIWMAGVYLMLLVQFLENKVAIELTRAEFVEAQEALVQMKNWFMRFPTILQACECIIEMLRGQYAHSVGCYNEAAFHFIEAVKLTESKSMQAMCQVYAAVSYICMGDAESSSKALDLIGPVYGVMDSFVGVRERTGVLFAYGLLLMKQQDLQEARNRLARGLQLTHTYLGNLQLVSQYLTILGSLALALHDTVQAREILRSSLTLAKKLYDIPTQIWVLSVLTALYKELGERGNEMENVEFQTKKSEDLHKRLADAHASIHHIEIIDKVRFEVRQLHELDNKREMAGPTMGVNLDIPESIGLSAPLPTASSSRLLDIDTGRRGRRRN